LFNLYKLSLNLIKKSENDIYLYNINNENEDENENDLLLDLKHTSKQIFEKLDISLRVKLQRKGITIIQNIYTGFDTEFKNIDAQTNKLLSVQFILNTRLILKIPKFTNFSLSTVGTLNSKIYKISKSLRSHLPSETLEINFNNLINECRVLKYNDFDVNINTLINKLKKLNISYFEDDDYFVFAFPRSPMVKFIQLTDNYSFESLIHKSNEMAKPYLQNSYNQLIDLLINEIIDDSKNIEVIDDSKNIEVIEDENEKDKISKTLNQNIDKKYTRVFMNIITTPKISITTPKVSVTRIKNNYMIAHLTSADLSMFSDFDKFKDQLDIINKNFYYFE
jgi:hypothetical protein